jgi:nitrite reductase/ring-hydroxylating ferredoxin subunit
MGRKWRQAGEDYIMRSFIICTLHGIHEDVKSGACRRHERDEKCIKYFVW